MVTYRGYRTSVQYDEETAYGTGATPATAIKGKISTLTINQTNNIIRTLGLGEGRNETFYGWGNYELTWSMEYELASFEFLQFLIGSMDGAGTTAAPYYLKEEDYMDFTAGADSGLKSFGMEVASLGSTANVDTLSGCVINTGSLTLNLNETLKCSLEGFGQKVTSGTSATAFVADTTKPWIFAQGAFKWNGSEVGRVTSASITINNNFDPDVGRQIGSRFPVAQEPGLRKYDWTITVKMTDTIATTLRDHFYGQANSPNTGIDPSEPTLYAIILHLAEGAASNDRQAQILLSGGVINDISKPVNIGDNIVELTINGAAKAGTTDTTNKPIKWWTTT